MQIYINMKAAGSRRPVLTKMPYEIPDSVSSVRELLESLVKIEVENYNRKNADDDPKTAEIMSKIILLAEDAKIKDPTILQQLS